MFNWKKQTVHNAIIQLGDTDDSGKGRHFKSRFMKDGLVKVEKFGKVLIKKENLDKFIDTMVGVPVIINHKDITEDNADDERVGVVNSVWYNNEDGWFWCDGVIWDKTAQNLITDKGWSVSCSYDVKLANDEGGSENNIKYDIEFLDAVFTHLALVNNPRYERANIVFNSKTEFVNNDKWITIHPNGENEKGRHILLKDGETPKDAIERTYKSNEKIDKYVSEYKEYFNDAQLKEFKKELARFDEYKGLENVDVKQTQETFKTLKPEEALQRLKDTNDLQERFRKEDKLRKRFYDYVKKSGVKDNRLYELGRFIGSFENYFTDKIPTFEEFRDDIRYNWNTDLALKYLADKSDFEKFDDISDKEMAKIKSGYEKFKQILLGKGNNMEINNGWITKYDEDGNPYHVNIEGYNEESDKKEDKKDNKTEKKESKKFTWKDKEYSLEELVDKGFKPMKYSGSIYKDGHLTYLEKNEGKHLYKLPISDDEYYNLKSKKEESKGSKQDDKKESKMSDAELVKAHFESQKQMEEDFKKAHEQGTLKAGQMFKSEALYGEIAQELKKRTGRSFSMASSEQEIKDALAKGNKQDDKKESKRSVIEKAEKDLSKNKFIPNSQKSILKKDLKGEEYKHFADKIEEMSEIVKNAPKMYETDGQKDKKPILHYFGGSYDNYVYEIDKESGMMFGAVNMGYGYELGYSSMEEINSVPKIELDLYFDGKLPKELSNKIDNSKERTMEIIDKLKALIFSVENGKDYTMVNNEKVDKRKLIDEVAGIMKSAGCDDEVIRTAIGKMEKIGYDKSEADTADNKKDDKVDNKCDVKNEDAEDEKEVKEVKEEVKEDVENCGKKGKVDNSKTDYFAELQKIYNSASSSIKEEPVYVSRADREQAADDYFRN